MHQQNTVQTLDSNVSQQCKVDHPVLKCISSKCTSLTNRVHWCMISCCTGVPGTTGVQRITQFRVHQRILHHAEHQLKVHQLHQFHQLRQGCALNCTSASVAPVHQSTSCTIAPVHQWCWTALTLVSIHQRGLGAWVSHLPPPAAQSSNG